jgi:hypothetical protein
MRQDAEDDVTGSGCPIEKSVPTLGCDYFSDSTFPQAMDSKAEDVAQ